MEAKRFYSVCAMLK